MVVDEKESDEEAEPQELRLNLNGDELKIWEFIVKSIESVRNEIYSREARLIIFRVSAK